jgi:hypothetical protein
MSKPSAREITLKAEAPFFVGELPDSLFEDTPWYRSAELLAQYVPEDALQRFIETRHLEFIHAGRRWFIAPEWASNVRCEEPPRGPDELFSKRNLYCITTHAGVPVLDLMLSIYLLITRDPATFYQIAVHQGSFDSKGVRIFPSYPGIREDGIAYPPRQRVDPVLQLITDEYRENMHRVRERLAELEAWYVR